MPFRENIGNEIHCEKLNEREKKQMISVIEYFRNHDEIDRATAESICGKGTTTTVGYLNRLIEVGVLQRKKAARVKDHVIL